MSLTAGEAQATAAALEALRAAVNAAESEAVASRNWLAWIGIEDEIARNARETAEVKRGLYNALLAARAELEASPDPDHEIALEIVDLANRSTGRETAAAIRSMVEASAPLAIAGRAAIETVESAGALLRIAIPVALVILAVLAVQKGKP